MKSKLPNFSVEYLRSILFYDPLTGDWIWKINKCNNKIKAGQKAGTKHNDHYWQIKINKRIYLAHILAWFYITGKWPLQDIDHINRIRDDNKFINLRLATQSQNSGNCLKRKRNTSGYKGVTWHNAIDKWMSQIRKDGKIYRLGFFDSLEDAALAYNIKAIEFFGEFANLNIIE